MVKKYLLVLACMIVVIQPVGAQDYFASASDFARLYVGAVEPQYQLSLWHDIPYYKGNANMYQGRVSYYGVVYDNVQLRFDQLEQRVVVLSPVGNVFCLPEQDHIDWFELDGHRFVHDPEDSTRYASVLCDGSTNGIRLYHSEWKIYSGEKILFGEKRYLKTLSTEDHYTLITSDGEKHHVKGASDVAKLIPEQKKQIKQFVKTHHLSFSKSEREYSLRRVVEGLPGKTFPLPLPNREGSIISQDLLANNKQALEVTTPLPPKEGLREGLLGGIPVLDNDTMSTGSARTKTAIST